MKKYSSPFMEYRKYILAGTLSGSGNGEENDGGIAKDENELDDPDDLIGGE